MADDPDSEGFFGSMWGSVKSAGSSFADGAVKGDFSKDDSLAGLAGQVIGGFVPGTGIRDAAANVVEMRENGVTWGGVASFGINVFSEVPLIGDAVKLASKGSKVAKAVDKAADASKALDKVSDVKKAEKVAVAAKASDAAPVNGSLVTGPPKVKKGGKGNPKKNGKKGKKKKPAESSTGKDGAKKTAGEPVDVITGKVYVAQEDFSLPWRLPLTWKRFYSSDSTREGMVGTGWESPADSRLTLREDGTVAFWHETPGGQVFPGLPVMGAELVDPSDGMRLIRHSSTVEVTSRSGVTHVFGNPESGQTEVPLLAIRDLNGNEISYVRKGGVLAEIRSSCGPWLELRHSGRKLRRVVLHHPVDPPRTLITYGRSKAGDLIAAFDPMGRAHTFEYDDHCLVRHTDRNGVSFHYDYDEIGPEGRCVHTWGDGGLFDAYLEHDPANRRVVTTDSCGQLSIVEYDARNRLLSTADSLGARVSYEYDEAGRTKAVTDPLDRRTSYAYDETGNLLELTRPDGVTLKWAYDGRGCPVSFTDALGNEWRQEFDEKLRLVRQLSPMGASREYRYGEKGDLIAFRDPRGYVTTFATDPYGASLRRLTDARGSASSWEVDSMGNVLAAVDAAGAVTRFRYDAKSRLTQVTRPDGAKVSCGYDRELNLTDYTDELGNHSGFEYGYVNRLVARHLPDGSTSRYEYDTENRLGAVTNGRGERYALQRDPSGRVIHEMDYWGRSTVYGYDAAGQLAESVDPLGRRTLYERDSLGLVVGRHFADGTVDRFTYNEAGQLVASASADAGVERSYDADGRLVAELQDGFQVEYVHDAAGNVIRRRSSAGNEVAYTYDAANLPASIRVNGREVLGITRDVRGLPVSESLGGRLSRHSTFDKRWRLTRQSASVGGDVLVDRSYDYDRAGNLLGLTDARKGSHQFGYDPVGQLVRHTDPAGRLHRFLRDAAGDFLKTESCDPFAPGEDIPPVENPAGAEPLPVMPKPGRGKPAEPAASREPIGRSIRKARFDGVSYRFDAAGNVIERTGGKSSLKLDWDCANRLHCGRAGDNIPVWFGYDAFGRRFTKKKKDRVTKFGWDGNALLAEYDGKSWREYIMQPGGFSPVAMVEGGQIYHYQTDQAGAPRELLRETGELVWSADYDAWGAAVVEDRHKVANPLRLQGQYFDGELGIAYNRNRYYDPHIGSFISQDPLGLAAGENLYAVAPNVQGWVDPLGLTGEVPKANASNSKSWNPVNGPGPLGEEVAKTFRSATYNERVLDEPLTLYRVYGGKAGEISPYWTATKPSGPLQSKMDSALLSEWGNTATNTATITVPKGTTIFEGFAGSQIGKQNPYENVMGGGNQIYIPKVDPNWLVK